LCPAVGRGNQSLCSCANREFVTLAGWRVWHVRGLPGRSQLEVLARATWEKLERKPVDETGSPLASLRIEVWKTRYQASSLQPQQTQIALEQFDFRQ